MVVTVAQHTCPNFTPHRSHFWAGGFCPGAEPLDAGTIGALAALARAGVTFEIIERK